MSVRPDLTALRIEREPEREQRVFPIGKIIGWAIVLIALSFGAVALYRTWIGPSRAPMVAS